MKKVVSCFCLWKIQALLLCCFSVWLRCGGGCPAGAVKEDYSGGGYMCICPAGTVYMDTGDAKTCTLPSVSDPSVDMSVTNDLNSPADLRALQNWIDVGSQPGHYFASPGRGGFANPLQQLCTRIGSTCDIATDGTFSGGLNFATCDAIEGFFAGRLVGAKSSGGNLGCGSGSGTPLLLGCGGRVASKPVDAGYLACTGFDRFLTCTSDEGWQCPQDVLDTASNSNAADGALCYCP